MANHEGNPQVDLYQYLVSTSEDERFAFGRVADLIQNAVETRRGAGTEGMSAEFAGNIDGVPYSVYLGPEEKEQ